MSCKNKNGHIRVKKNLRRFECLVAFPRVARGASTQQTQVGTLSHHNQLYTMQWINRCWNMSLALAVAYLCTSNAIKTNIVYKCAGKEQYRNSKNYRTTTESQLFFRSWLRTISQLAVTDHVWSIEDTYCDVQCSVDTFAQQQQQQQQQRQQRKMRNEVAQLANRQKRKNGFISQPATNSERRHI